MGEWVGGLGAIRKRLPSSDDGALNLYHVLVEVVEVGVVQGLLRRDALVRRVLEALVQEVQARVFETRRELRQLEPRPRREDGLVISQRRHAGPHTFIGSTQHAKDLEQLVDLAVAGEHRLLGLHLDQDRADGPHVHGRRVGLRP